MRGIPGFSNQPGDGSPFAADFNGDGKADLICGTTVFLGNGDGTLRTGETAGTNAMESVVLTADFNNDANPDVLLSELSGQFGVALGHGDGTFGSELLITSLANPEPPKQRTGINIDPKLLDNYTGRYQWAPNLILEITRDGDRLFAQAFAQATGLPKFEVFAESEKKFFYRAFDAQISFETGPEGRATSLILHRAAGAGGENRDMRAARLS